MRAIPLCLLALACEPAALNVDALDDDLGQGWATTPSETWTDPGTEPEPSPWDGALLAIRQPASGAVLSYGAVHHFDAVIRSADGDELPFDEVVWTSSQAEDWYEVAAAFDTDALPIGEHAFTATAALPNGDTVRHTVGGVRVQHPYAGTYAGMLEVDGAVVNIPISCIGAGILVVERYGEEGVGEADCLVSLLGIDVPLQLVYDLDLGAEGAITGSVGVDLLGWFTYNFDATGTLDASAAMEVAFAGEVPLMGPLTGSSSLDRISLDSQ